MNQNKKDIAATLLFVVVVTGCVLVSVLLFDNDSDSKSVAWQEKIQQSLQSVYKPVRVEVFPEETVIEEEPESVPEEEPELIRVFPTEEWAARLENYSPEEFTGSNYGEPANCIDEDVSYKVNYLYYSYTGQDNLNLCASAVQLEGDIPNLKYINDTLMNFALQRAEWEMDTRELLDEKEVSFVETDSYVTYNCETYISVVIRTRWTGGRKDELTDSDLLRTFNIDLENGIMLINDEIVDMTGFGREYMRRAEEIYGQRPEFSWMGETEYETMICYDPLVFFTPLGMELGFNNMDGETWMTITFEEYEEFLRGDGMIFKR